MRTLHHSKVFVKKIKNDDKISIDYTYENGENDEKFNLECSDSPHPDFFQAWKEGLLEEFRRHLDLSEDRSLHLIQVHIDHDETMVKADLHMTIEDYAKPVKISTPKFEVSWPIVENLCEEAAKYVTHEKRSQGDMFSASDFDDKQPDDTQDTEEEYKEEPAVVGSDSSDPVDEFDRTMSERRERQVVGFD